MAARLCGAVIAVCPAVPSHAGNTIWAPHGEKEFVGHALDYETGNPVPGAWVIATYILGRGGLHEAAHCSVAEVVRADSDGKYVLPFYEGLPPQFLEAFSHRVQRSPSPRDVNRDVNTLRWIVTVTKIVNGKGVVAAVEGPFRNQEAALKASRRQQDVWLKPYVGTDDEWIKWLSTSGTNARMGCASFRSRGITDWLQAKLEDIESMPDSSAKAHAVDQLKRRIQLSIELASPRPPG